MSSATVTNGASLPNGLAWSVNANSSWFWSLASHSTWSVVLGFGSSELPEPLPERFRDEEEELPP
jgi:hypothetical protein